MGPRHRGPICFGTKTAQADVGGQWIAARVANKKADAQAERRLVGRSMIRDRWSTQDAAGTLTRVMPYWVAILAALVGIMVLAAGCSNTLSQAEQAEHNGDVAGATALYQEWLKTHPDDLTAVKALAGIFYVERKFDEALPMEEKAVSLDPKEVQIRVELGFNYLNHQNQAAKAVAVLQEAVALEGTAENLGFLAQGQMATGDDKGAESTLRRGLAEDKTYPHTYTLLLALLDRQGRTAEAAELRQAAAGAGVVLPTAASAQ
jgi:predicted Zn-dependent protease